MLRKLTLLAAVAAVLVMPAEAMARGHGGGHGGGHVGRGGGHHGGFHGGRGHGVGWVGRGGGCRHYWNGVWHPYCFR